jgi:COP9 signalosome complex subunit 6
MATPMNISEAGGDMSIPVGNPHVGSVSGTVDQPREDGSLLLHPLVVINISDHFNRFAAMRLFSHPHAPFDGEPRPPVLVDCHGNIRVIGILLGNQDGRTVDISHSFELPGKLANNYPDDHTVIVDVEFAQLRIDQYKQIFPDYHVVGWYTTGSVVTDDDVRLHRDVFSVLNESPFLMLVNVAACMKSLAGRLTSAREASPHPVASSSSSGRPAGMLETAASMVRGAPNPTSAIVIYQAELRSVESQLRNVMVPVPHRFASADSERIAVDHVTRHAVPGGGSSSASQHLGSLRRSVRMLSARIDVLVRFLDASAKGEIPKDHALLRNVAAVCARLPAIEAEEFATAFKEEHHDSMVVSYLSGITKSLCAMNELVDAFQFVYDKPSGGVGGGGARRRM